MRKLILSIVVLLSVVGLNAQTKFKVNVDSFYNFKFKDNISASEALNKNQLIELPGKVGFTEITVDEFSKTIKMRFEGKSYTLYMIGHPNGDKNAYMYQYNDGEKDVYGQMSFVEGDEGGRYVVAESEDDENPSYQKAWIAKIK